MSQQSYEQYLCVHCGYQWTRSGDPTRSGPSRCPVCGRLMDPSLAGEPTEPTEKSVAMLRECSKCYNQITCIQPCGKFGRMERKK